jgi:gamma-glutamyltranspeptidase/glutathione hydrolase
MHTIIPGMVMAAGRPVMPFGAVGGDYQPVGHAQLVASVFGEGLDVQAALDRPRSLAYGGVLKLETTHPAARFGALAALGHRVEPAEDPLGGGHAIFIDRARGVLVGGTDPRKDGIALGW